MICDSFLVLLLVVWYIVLRFAVLDSLSVHCVVLPVLLTVLEVLFK